jgi:hypothetical protein
VVQGTSWEADTRSARQETPRLSRNRKVQKSPTLSHMNPVRTLTPYPIFAQVSPIGLSPSGVPTKVLYEFLICPTHATCLAHVILLDLNILLKGADEPKLWSFFVMQRAGVARQYGVWLRTGRPGCDPPQGQMVFLIAPAFRLALRPTHNPIQWVPGALSPGVKRGQGVTLTTHPHLVPR